MTLGLPSWLATLQVLALVTSPKLRLQQCMNGSLNQKLECRSIVHKTSLNSYVWVCGEIQIILSNISHKFF
jgi:hypothetical protein